ncbi:Crp/Fnr family transcriptional regulator [Variovorax sp. RA8]|uniref:Crp/Fnr family transcriptional regulator n=1 Tax=Variovorax sp. (strain JCM 16519 / RA8) TaxID=662548 RepID=UPI001318199B|nr:cyclic nucleotide-binding domain-containing protein [Variovorax sp. RA8]VTU13690.1 cAMP regulatory protein [Variovorax sp. RA8]
MPKIAKSAIVVPSRLDPAARQEFIDALYRVHCEVFDGVSRDSFAKYVVESPAEHTWINVHRNHAGEIVGYFALHIFERELAGQASAIFRAEAGTLRAYRGGNTNTRFGLKLGVPYLLRYPGRRVYYLGSLVHPSSYSLFAKHFDVVWPSTRHPPPPAVLSFMDELANSFGLERVSPDNPLTRQVHWITRDSEVERSYWRNCDKPAARFFIEANPGYSEGDGLVTLIRVDAHNLWHAISAFFAERYTRRKEGLMVTLYRLPIGGQLLRPAEVIRRLKATALFGSFDAPSLATLAESAQIVALPAGRTIFRAGDPGNELYVIARGAAYVLAGSESEGEDHIIDQLATGAMFGEIAMLSGERRSATLRTATATLLIQISREALFSILEAHPKLSEVLWKNFAARRFDDCVRGLPAWKTLERAARLAVVDAGQHRLLAAGERAEVSAGEMLLVLLGNVQVEQAGTSTIVRAPALFDTKQAMAVTANGAARIVCIAR